MNVTSEGPSDAVVVSRPLNGRRLEAHAETPADPSHTKLLLDETAATEYRPEAAAQRIVEWLELIVPESRSIVMLLAADCDFTQVLAASKSLAVRGGDSRTLEPARWISRSLEATRASIVPCCAPARLGALPWAQTLEPEYTLQCCMALPPLGESALLVGYTSAEHAEKTVNAIATLKALLRGHTSTCGGEVGDSRIVMNVARAKLEWERTVDALSELVFLLDSHGRVVRANRAVEEWGLGRVESAPGRSLHDNLHRGCKDPSCGLARSLDLGWQRFLESGTTEFQAHDGRAEKILQIRVQGINASERPTESTQDLAVVVIADVTQLRLAQRKREALNEELERRVTVRTRELSERNHELQNEIARREAADLELKKSRDELARLSDTLIRAQELERRNLAMELHDGLGQSLGALKYTFEHAIAILHRGRSEELVADLEGAVEHIRHAISEARAIATNLRPPVLDDMGPVSAVKWLCREFRTTYALEIELVCDLDNAAVPKPVAPHLFRIVQEALNNVAKHAAASSAVVSLSRRDGILTLEVRDDGVGFQPGRVRVEAGLGIAGMRRRADLTGGRFMIESTLGHSTRVYVDWDLETLDALAC